MSDVSTSSNRAIPPSEGPPFLLNSAPPKCPRGQRWSAEVSQILLGCLRDAPHATDVGVNARKPDATLASWYDARMPQGSLTFRLAAAPVVVLLLSFPPRVFGWGGDGHQVAALIAEERLTPEARAAVKELLGPADISDAV